MLEDLERLWFNASRKSSSLADKLSRFAYRRLQHAIITKALQVYAQDVELNWSTTIELAICSKCGFIADRDTIGVMNIYIRALRRMRGSQGSPQSAPAVNDETRGSRRTKISQ